MYDICIVGAGIAGASLAAVLGKKGFRIALIERNWDEPNEIIGELLQPGGVGKITELGLGSALDNIDAQYIEGYAMCLEDEWLSLEYEQNRQNPPYIGYGFRYGKFVQNLRNASKDCQNVECIVGNVRKLLESSEGIEGVEYKDQHGAYKQLKSKLAIVCQGSSSPLRKTLNKSQPDVKGFMLGLILKDCKLPFAHCGHIILADPAPVLSYPVSDKEIRVLIDFPAEMPALKGESMKSYLLESILPQMPPQLQEGFRNAVHEGGFKAKPCCSLPSRPILRDGALLLGDSLNMRHPVTGGGMTVALTDVKTLSEKLGDPSNLHDRSTLQNIVSSFYRQRHEQNATINILAFALYSVFRHKLLKKACFNYLGQGGVHSLEPMSILSGKSRNRILLIKHFFAVAAYSILNQNKVRSKNMDSGILQSIVALIYSITVLVPLIIDEIPRVFRNQNV